MQIAFNFAKISEVNLRGMGEAARGAPFYDLVVTRHSFGFV